MKKIIKNTLPALILAFTAPTLMAAEKSPLSYNYIEFGATYGKSTNKVSREYKGIESLANKHGTSIKDKAIRKNINKDKKGERTGGQLNLSFEVGPNAFILLGFDGDRQKQSLMDYEDDDLDISGNFADRNFIGHLGFGGYASLLDNLDLVGELVYLRSEYQLLAKNVNVEFIDDPSENFLEKNKTVKLTDNGWGAGLGVRSVLANWFELNAFVRHADVFNEKNTIYTVGTRAHMSLFSIGLDFSEYHTRSKRSHHHVDLTARFRF